MSDTLASEPAYRPGGTIVLATHNPSWAANFARESAIVTAVLGDLLIALHHIGSTAIPTIVAKPVIDMLAAVTRVELLDEQRSRLESLGYEALGEFGIAGRRYFRKNSNAGVRTHQLHAFAAESMDFQRHLDFRDYLRAHSAEATEYAELKQSLARHCATNMEAYTNGKSAFIRDVERRAAVWRRSSASQHP
jgi:GrpB-like predicted nucleotidyltransferase (UPF0157 family)